MSKKKVMVNEEKIETTFGFAITEDEPSWANQENSDEQEEKITKSPSINNDTKTKKKSSFKKYFQNLTQQENKFPKEATITQSAPLQIPDDDSDEFQFNFYPNSVTSYGKNSGSKIPKNSKTEIIKPKTEKDKIIEIPPLQTNKTYAKSLPIDIINNSRASNGDNNNTLWKYNIKYKPITKQNEEVPTIESEEEYATISGNSRDDFN